jgi:predicted dehydrogenase
VGIGFGQQVLVPAFAAEPRCRVAGICAGDFERARRVADRLDLPKAYGGWQDLVADYDVDAVAIAAPPAIQPSIALAAFSNGKHVFCEKPLAAGIEDADKMLSAARLSGKAHMVDFEFPEVPVWQEAKHILDSGKLGTLTHAVVSWQVETYASRMGLRTWKTDAGMGGGVLNSFVSHSFHYLEWLLGPIRALGARLFAPTGELAAGTGDSVAMLWLEHQEGVSSSLCVSSSAFLGTGHRIEIYGRQGSIVLENSSKDYVNGFVLRLGTRETNRLECLCETPVSAADGRIAAVNSLVKRFVGWAGSGIASKPDFEDGYRVQRLLDAAFRSNRTSQRITLE